MGSLVIPCPLHAPRRSEAALLVLGRHASDLSAQVPQAVAMFAASGEAVPATGDGRAWTFVMTESQLAQQPNKRASGEVGGVELALIKDGARLYAVQVRLVSWTKDWGAKAIPSRHAPGAQGYPLTRGPEC